MFSISRQYALFLSYFQYCHSVLHPEVPMSVLHFLLREDQVGDEDIDLQKVGLPPRSIPPESIVTVVTCWWEI